MSNSFDDQNKPAGLTRRKREPKLKAPTRVSIGLRVDAELARELDRHLMNYVGSKNDFIIHLIKTAIAHGTHLRNHKVIVDERPEIGPVNADD